LPVVRAIEEKPYRKGRQGISIVGHRVLRESLKVRVTLKQQPEEMRKQVQ
jgi:hypothetical protein